MIAEYRKITPKSLEEVRVMLMNSEHQIILLLEMVSRKMASVDHSPNTH
jgi:hypothetical protein